MIPKEDGSWSFLADYFENDKSIVGLLNIALGTNEKGRLRDNDYGTLLNDITSLLPRNIEKVSYWDFIHYVAPDNYDMNETELEEAFLNHIWFNILSLSGANKLFSSEIRNSSLPSVCIPYLILLSMGISVDWFLYGGTSLYWFVDDVNTLGELKTHLMDGCQKWRKKWRVNIKSLKALFLWPMQKMPSQLYTFVTLLIILRREWQWSSQDSLYIKLKAHSLYKKLSSESVKLSILSGIYNQYEYADHEIKDVLQKEVKPVDLHPLIAARLIENEAYPVLLVEDSSDSNGVRQKNFISFEEPFGSRIKGSRLLIHYVFPFTAIREDDVFCPHIITHDNQVFYSYQSLVDSIYLSLKLGEKFREQYRLPREGELFDYIQIELMRNQSGNYDDSYVNAFRNSLKLTGDFLIVKSEEDHLKDQILKDAFSDFRHDLKVIMIDTDIVNLKKVLSSSLKCQKAVKNLSDLTERLLLSSDLSGNNADFQELRSSLKMMDNDDSFVSPDFEDIGYIIRSMRDKVEDYVYEPFPDFVEQMRDDLHRLRSFMVDYLDNCLTKCSQIANYIEDSYDELNSYIKMAGRQPSPDEFSNIKLKDFLVRYVRHASMLTRAFSLTTDFTSLGDDCIVRYNMATLRIILNSILDNAAVHGFKNFTSGTPIVHFETEDIKEHVLLKICNNGTPIDITDRNFRTRGVFSGVTGHTGIGGYQISKYAELQGGFVRIPTERKWNTEIHFFIKLRFSEQKR